MYQRRPGWGGYVLRLLLACTAMVAVLLVMRQWLPGFDDMGKWERGGSLALLVGSGGLTYLLAMLALGFRPRDLRGQ